jgi:hypothetical protein
MGVAMGQGLAFTIGLLEQDEVVVAGGFRSVHSQGIYLRNRLDMPLREKTLGLFCESVLPSPRCEVVLG